MYFTIIQTRWQMRKAKKNIFQLFFNDTTVLENHA